MTAFKPLIPNDKILRDCKTLQEPAEEVKSFSFDKKRRTESPGFAAESLLKNRLSPPTFQDAQKALQRCLSFPEIKALSLFSLVLLLSGCGSYSGSFDCPIGEGLKCASLSEVNQKVDQGNLNMAFPSEKTDESCVNCKKVYWRSDLSKPRVYHHKGRSR